MKKGIFYILVCHLIILFSQCQKDIPIKEEIKEGVLIDTIRLSQADLNIVPYTLNDSFFFKDSLGNSKIFKVKYRFSTFPRMYKGGGTNVPSADYYDIEELNVRIKDTGDYTIGISLRAPLPPYISTQHLNKNSFQIGLSGVHVSTDLGNTFYCFIDTVNFYYIMQGPPSIQAPIPYYPTFTIINKTYSSVYELINTQTCPPYYISCDFPQTTYYNKSQGIVGFQMKNGTKWYLDN